MKAHTHSIRLGVEALEDRSLLNADIAVVDVTTPDFTHIDVRYVISGNDSPAFELRAYLSADQVLDAADVLLSGRQSIISPTDLKAGEEPHRATLTLPTRAPVSESRRFVLVVADWDYAVEQAGNPSRADNVLLAVPLLDAGHALDRDGNILPFEAVTSEAGPFTGAILPGTADHAKLAAVDLASVWKPSSRFQFGYTEGEPELWQRNEDRRAQATVVTPLRALVDLLNADLARVPSLWADAVYSINDAYDSLHQHVAAESLHYEGRALDLDVLDRPSGGAEMARLAGLAWLAGFDFVLNESTHVHASERAAFATTIDQRSLQQAVEEAFQLGRIGSAAATARLVRTLDGFDAAIQKGRISDALAKLFEFRVGVQSATGGAIHDTGFAQLLILNVDRLIARLQSDVPTLPEGKRSHTVRGTGHFVSPTQFVATGHGTHLGRFEQAGSVQLSPTANPTVFRAEGWAIDTAANGDMLFAVISGQFDALTGTITATVTYFGGTGRFADTQGAASLSAQLLPDGSIKFAIEGGLSIALPRRNGTAAQMGASLAPPSQGDDVLSNFGRWREKCR